MSIFIEKVTWLHIILPTLGKEKKNVHEVQLVDSLLCMVKALITMDREGTPNLEGINLLLMMDDNVLPVS